MADLDEPVTIPSVQEPDPAAAPQVKDPVVPWYWRRYRKHTPLGWIGRILLGLLAAILLAWAILFITKGRFLKHSFERIASQSTHRTVKVAGDFQFYFNPINLKFVAEGLSVSNPDWAGPRNFFEAKRIDLRGAVVPFLFSGTRRINRLELDGARVDMEWDKAHQHNSWTFGTGKGKPFELPLIRSATVTGTQVRYRDPRQQLAADIVIETAKATDSRFASAIRLNGTGTARTTPFAVTGALLSPNATITGGENQLMLHFDAARTKLDVVGTLPGATELEGSKLRVTARGGNLADLLAVIGVAIPETRTYKLNSALTKAGNEWRFTGLNGFFGDSDIAGTLTVALKEPRLLLTATLATRKLDIIDVAPFIGYNPDLVAAKGAAGAITRVGGTPRLLPDAKLRVDALRNFDADVRYTVRTLRARSLPVSNIALTLGLDNSLLTLSPLTFDMARGHVASDITINARRAAVVTDYDIRLSPTPLGVLLAGWGVEESGTTGTVKARIKLTGTGDTVHDSLSNANGRVAIILPKGSFWTRNIQLSELDLGTFVYKLFQGKLKEPVQINCGLIGFTVRNGIAAADPILIDTQKNVMIGRGGFSFRNEALDIAFRADGKKFSLISAQSPVGIGGYFAAPAINPISPQLVERAGVGLGLSLVATPLAGVLAFVDVGDAKSAACGPVLSGATAKAQTTTKGKPRDDVGRGTTAKAEDGKRSNAEKKGQKKKFLGIF
ncbi:AsmA family protein [Sphingomonas alpina]|uniref:AsmA family protein n=1 Tax=Sphingomonas alpina TaxID=653931 RepID=A0A7H0LHM6_9SPHN|nr:AsmA family protein [Sphingomonas alpina]QNQ09179.1 AsmA family protein [Sphingomonas alpina]